MIPHSLRKLFHQHVMSWLHSRRAIAITLFTCTLLLISFLQFGDTLLEWSVQSLGCAAHHTDNIASRSFQRHICYDEPIDVVYTWVNGSDPWHQQQLQQLRMDAASMGQFSKQVGKEEKGGEPAGQPGGFPTDRRSLLCSSSKCVQAKAVLVSPVISPSDLSEVLDDLPVHSLISYNISNGTVALVPASYELEELLEDRTLDVNDRKFTFVSVHLVVADEQAPTPAAEACEPCPFALVATGVGQRVSEADLQQALDAVSARVDVYRSRNLAVVYLRPGAQGGPGPVRVGEEEVELARACMLRDVQPSSSDNELRLSRFKDNEELRYSIRSLEKHAGWVRRIFIVTDGQIPSWLDVENPRVTIVTHEEIFLNRSHLPTFSSSAIESHLHRIPGVSRKFLYFNDDVLLGQDVLPEDFYSHSEGYKVHLSWHVPACAEGCPAGWISDGFCDAACNNAYCNFDGGDCANKTQGTGTDFNDDFDMDLLQFTGTCHPGCLNAWLADRYCDTVCNHPQCAYDAGDCGLDKLDAYQHIVLVNEQKEYWTTPGGFVVLFNTSGLQHGHSALADGSYKQAKGVRVVSVYPKKEAVILLLYNNATGFVDLTLSFPTGNSSSDADQFEFRVHFDSSPQTAPSSMEVKPSAVSKAIFPTIPERLKSPQHYGGSLSERIREEFTDIQSNASAILHRLQTQLHSGQISDFGFHHRKAILLGQAPDVNISRPQPARTRPSRVFSVSMPETTFQPKAPATLAARPMDLQASISRARSRLRLKDAFADSLRHVNRLYNTAFGTEARKVPAHIPHFIDREVMGELQRQFPVEFDETSRTRIRGSKDMQFAFSYFYYIMSSKRTLEAGEFFDDVDRDHSGMWDERELHLAALRSLQDGPLVPAKMTDFYRMVANCTAGQTDNVSVASLPVVSKQQLLTCPEAVGRLVTAAGKRNKFKFRLGDAEGFTFVRVSNNVSIVQKELDGILRKPKKFLCINDEVDYTRDDAGDVQAAIKEFFRTLFPLRSTFELPTGRRNRFTHVHQLKQWKRQARMMQMGVVVSGVVVAGIVVWFCFPRLRRKICRSFRQAYLAPLRPGSQRVHLLRTPSPA